MRDENTIDLSALAREGEELPKLELALFGDGRDETWTRRFAASGKPCRVTFQGESWTSRFEASEKSGKVRKVEDPAAPASLA